LKLKLGKKTINNIDGAQQQKRDTAQDISNKRVTQLKTSATKA